jgi:hypothetical protein
VSQLALLPRFDGPALTRSDEKRLGGHLARVYAVMRDGRWRTLGELAELVGASEAGVSARLRDLRNEKFRVVFPNGGVERRRVVGGLYEYRLLT